MSKEHVTAKNVQEVLHENKVGEVKKADFAKAIKKAEDSITKLNKDVAAIWKLSKKVREDEFEGAEFRDFIKSIKDLAASTIRNVSDPLTSVAATLKDKLPRF